MNTESIIQGGSNKNVQVNLADYNITGCNDSFRLITVVNTLADLILKYQDELSVAVDSLQSPRNAESVSGRLVLMPRLEYSDLQKAA